jgi:hypothetical protein
MPRGPWGVRLRASLGVATYDDRMGRCGDRQDGDVRCAIVPIAVRPKGSREAAVRLTELEQNQDKLLPNLQARHMCGGASLVLGWGLELFHWGAGACVVLH